MQPRVLVAALCGHGLPVAVQDLAHDRASVSGLNGLARNATFESRTPWRTIASSV